MNSNVRLREVCCQNLSEKWKELKVHDDRSEQLAPNQAPSKEGASGKILGHSTSCPSILYWRSCDNVIEFVVENLTESAQRGCLRVICPESRFTGSVTALDTDTGGMLLFSSRSALHLIEFAPQHPHWNLVSDITRVESYSVNTASGISLSHCATLDTDTVAFSVIKDEGTASVFMLHEGVLSETELRQETLLNKLWKGMARMSRMGPNDNGDAVGSIFITAEDGTSLFQLTKDMHLKKWSTQTWGCMADWNLMSFTAWRESGSFHALHMKLLTYSGVQMLGVLWAQGTSKQILLLDPAGSGLTKVALLRCGHDELIDYTLADNNLAVLWIGQSGDAVMKYTSFLDSNVSDWRDVFLQPAVTAPCDVTSHFDPKETFTDFLFHPSRFSLKALAKAVAVVRHEFETAADEHYDVEQLKASAIRAVDNQIRSGIYSEEVGNTEYRNLQLKEWTTFCSYVMQYQEVYMQPLAIVGGDSKCPSCLIRKGSIAFLRYCDPLEQQVLFPTDSLDETRPLDQDVVTMMQCLASIRTHCQGFEDQIYISLVNGALPSDVIRETVSSMMTRSDHTILKDSLTAHLQNTENVLDSLQVLCRLLDIVSDLRLPQSGVVTPDKEAPSPFVTSSLSRALLCAAVEDSLVARFNVCCALALLTVYLEHLREDIGESHEFGYSLQDIRISLFDLLRAYTAAVWICRQPARDIPSTDINATLMEALKITNADELHSAFMEVPAFMSKPRSMLEHFLSGVGSVKVKVFMADTSGNPEDEDFMETQAAAVMATMQAIWPISHNVVFCEFMLSKSYLIELETYCQLLDGWCKWAQCSRLFLLGHCFLVQGEPSKALTSFEAAMYGMMQESDQRVKMGVSPNHASDELLRQQKVDLCIKVINLFEQASYSEQVVQMAHHAVKLAQGTTADTAALWTKIFKYNLDLYRYDAAYNAMLANPDPLRTLDCLRLFLGTLCEKQLLTSLVSYQYKDGAQRDLLPDVIAILYSKARSVDLTVRNYYDLIFSIHVFHNDMLSAASAMYECAQRLRVEITGITALQKQAKCYLACMTSLNCVDPEYAWLVPSSFCEADHPSRRSAKRTSHGSAKARDNAAVTVLTLDDIGKEYLLINMRLRLIAVNPKALVSGTHQPEASELITQLSLAGMYDEAMQVSVTFQCDLAPVFDSLSHRCLKASRQANQLLASDDDCESLSWLSLSQLPAESAYSRPVDQAWSLLRHYLERHEDQTRYYRCVVTKLLANSVGLPEWLLVVYKKKNVAELIRLYLGHDMLEEATGVTIEYLEAVLGRNYERFGLERPLEGTMLPCSMWIPTTSIDILLKALRELSQSDSFYKEMHKALKTAADNYRCKLALTCVDAADRLKTITAL